MNNVRKSRLLSDIRRAYSLRFRTLEFSSETIAPEIVVFDRAKGRERVHYYLTSNHSVGNNHSAGIPKTIIRSHKLSLGELCGAMKQIFGPRKVRSSVRHQDADPTQATRLLDPHICSSY